MSSIIKRICLILIGSLLPFGCIIQNPSPDGCTVKTITVEEIHERGVKDVVFTDTEGQTYYINRGLEQGLQLASLQEDVLDKNVTLHLANVIYGTTAHIAQLAVDGQVIYTEFDE